MAQEPSDINAKPPIEEEKAAMERPPSEDVEKALDADTVAKSTTDQQEYPPMRKTIVVMISLYMAAFLVSLDRTIIATAVPSEFQCGRAQLMMRVGANSSAEITDEFHSLGDIGWYGSVYMLMGCAFQLFLGRLYTFYSPKKVFLCCIFLFEVGSAICGAAPNSPVFIVGRAVAGLGAAGIFGGAIVLTMHLVPLHKRPVFVSLNGAVFGISSVVGPLIGGGLTTNVTWRWCFYINLPVGGFTMVVLFFILTAPSPKNANLTLKERVAQLDIIGTSIFIPCMVCLLLALQWGGSTYAWNSSRIIALLVLFGVLLIVFAGVQVWKKNGTLPPRIIKQRSIAAGVLYTICVGATMLVMAYYLPLWFQAIKGVTAVKSGIMTIPFVLSLVIGAIFAGGCTQRFGYYVPLMLASAIVVPIAAGLFTTFQTDTGHAKWIGYQVLIGFGIGLGMQQSSMAAQTCLEKIDVPTGVSLMFFGQQLGGTVFVSVGQNILSSRLISGLAAAKIPGLDPSTVVNAGATNLRDVVRPEYLGAVLKAYNYAVTTVFDVAVGTSCVLIVGAAFMEWRSVKKDKVKTSGTSAGQEVSDTSEQKK